MQKIANDELTLTSIPAASADWRALAEFALTFDGYETWGSFEKCAEIANAKQGNTLTELRTCLFFEQRRWRHFGYDPDDATMLYVRGIVEKIRVKVAVGEFE